MTYYVKYKMYSADDVKGVCVAARNRFDAYDLAVYDKIQKAEGGLPYAAWVHEVTYSNGKRKLFNTHEGNPF